MEGGKGGVEGGKGEWREERGTSQLLPCVVNARGLLDLFITKSFSLSDPSAFAQRARVMRSLNNFCPQYSGSCLDLVPNTVLFHPCFQQF